MSDRTPPRQAVGLCVPCSLGKHEKCNDAISLTGCACPCNDE